MFTRKASSQISVAESKPSTKWWVWPVVSLVAGIVSALFLLILYSHLPWRVYFVTGVAVGILMLFLNPATRFLRVVHGILGLFSLQQLISFVFEGQYDGQHLLIKTPDIPVTVFVMLVVLAIVALVLDFFSRGGKLMQGPFIQWKTHRTTFNNSGTTIGVQAEKIEETHHHYHTSLESQEKKSPKFLTHAASPSPLFTGRDQIISEIHDSLGSQGDLLILCGEGGVGKTSVARAYWYRYQNEYNNLAWLDCSTSIENALLDTQLEFALGLKYEGLEVPIRKQRLLAAMANLGGKNLLIIDNANDHQDLHKSWFILPNWHVFITSRANPGDLGPKTTRLDVLSVEDARKAFLAYAQRPKLANDHIDEMLDKVGRNTLLIEILGKLIKEDAYPTVEALQKALVEKDVLVAVSGLKVDIGWRGISSSQVEHIIAKLFDLNLLSRAEKLWLSRLAKLPSVFVPSSHLRMIFKGGNMTPKSIAKSDLKYFFWGFFSSYKKDQGEMFNNLNSLIRSGWVEEGQIENERVLKVHQMVRIVINKLSTQYDDDRFLIHLWWLFYDEDVSLDKRRPFINYAGEWIRSQNFKISFIVHEIPRFIGRFYFELGDVDTAMKWLTFAKFVSEELNKANKNPLLKTIYKKTLSEALSTIGDIYSAQGRMEDSIIAFTQAFDMRKSLINRKNDFQAFELFAKSHLRIGMTYHDKWQYDEALTYYQNAYQLLVNIVNHKKSSISVRAAFALIHEKIGRVNEHKGNLEVAFDFYNRSLAISQAIVEHNPKSQFYELALSSAYEHLGGVYELREQLEDAMGMYQNANQIILSFLSRNSTSNSLQQSYATVLGRIGDVLQAQGHIEDAFKHYDKEVKILKSLVDQDSQYSQWTLSCAYQELGNLHKSQCLLDDALLDYQKAFEIRKILVYNNGAAWLRSGLAEILLKIGEAHIAKGQLEEASSYLGQGLNNCEILLRANQVSIYVHESLIMAFKGFANIASLQNETKIAQEFLLKAVHEAQFMVDHRGTPKDLNRLQETKNEITALQSKFHDNGS